MKRLFLVVGGAAAVAGMVALARRRPAPPRRRLIVVPPQVPAARPEVDRSASRTRNRSRRRSFSIRNVLLTLVVLGAAGAAAGFGSYSAFSATTSNSGNAFSSGTVIIGDNDSNSALLSLSGAKPADSSTGCIKVTYTGSLAAVVHLYGSVSGSLGQYLTLTVTRGTNSSAFSSCAGFSADASDYFGYGAGVIYSGNLSAFASTYAAGIVDPTSWATNDAHSYKFVVTVQDNNSAQGLTANASFTWEARNS